MKARLKQFSALTARKPQQPKWVAVLDTSVLFAGTVATHPQSAALRVIEAGIAGFYDAVLSQCNWDETVAQLQAKANLAPEQAGQPFEPLLGKATWVPLSPDDPSYASAVRDPDDVAILRTAMSVLEVPALATRPGLYIVTENSRDFRVGENWYMFRLRTAHQFWQELRRAG